MHWRETHQYLLHAKKKWSLRINIALLKLSILWINWSKKRSIWMADIWDHTILHRYTLSAEDDKSGSPIKQMNLQVVSNRIPNFALLSILLWGTVLCTQSDSKIVKLSIFRGTWQVFNYTNDSTRLCNKAGYKFKLSCNHIVKFLQ